MILQIFRRFMCPFFWMVMQSASKLWLFASFCTLPLGHHGLLKVFDDFLFKAPFIVDFSSWPCLIYRLKATRNRDQATCLSIFVVSMNVKIMVVLCRAVSKKFQSSCFTSTIWCCIMLYNVVYSFLIGRTTDIHSDPPFCISLGQQPPQFPQDVDYYAVVDVCLAAWAEPGEGREAPSPSWGLLNHIKSFIPSYVLIW